MSARPLSLALAQAAARAFLFSLVFLALGCGSKDPVVATVNGEEIHSLELKRQVRVFLSVRPQATDNSQTRQQVLDQVIKQRLLVQAAKQSGLDRDPKLQALVVERRQALRGELEKTITDAKAQLQSLDEAVQARTLIEALSQARRVSMTVTVQDLKKAYESRAAQGPLPPFEQVRDQLLEQVILDRLVDEARSGAKVDVRPDALQ